MSTFNPTCPTNCSSAPPVVDFDLCNPELSFGEVEWIYVAGHDFTGLTDFADAADWASHLDDDGLTIDDIRTLHVMGDLPIPEADEIVIHHGEKVWSKQTFTLNFDVVDLTDDNYEFLTYMECNTRFRVWFATADYIYGGNDGIEANIRMSNVIERGIKSLGKFTGKIVWESKFSPRRAANPLN
jgi:hypothetical protein